MAQAIHYKHNILKNILEYQNNTNTKAELKKWGVRISLVDVIVVLTCVTYR